MGDRALQRFGIQVLGQGFSHGPPHDPEWQNTSNMDREGEEINRGQGRMALFETGQKTPSCNKSLSPIFISLQVMAFMNTVVSGRHSSIEVEALSTIRGGLLY